MSSSLNTVNEERNQSLEDALKSPEAFMLYILNGRQYISCAEHWPVYKDAMLEMLLTHQEVFLRYASSDFICELVRLYPHVREREEFSQFEALFPEYTRIDDGISSYGSSPSSSPIPSNAKTFGLITNIDSSLDSSQSSSDEDELFEIFYKSHSIDYKNEVKLGGYGGGNSKY